MSEQEVTQINIKNVPVHILNKAKQIARKQDRNFNQVVRELLRKWVAEQEKQSQK